MSSGPLSDLLRRLRGIALTAEADLEDSRLLERFIAHRDEAAFEALLRRHGPMVLGVCRRLLLEPHDTEDAFQATFLVLLRKASSLRNRVLLANWLYGVAYRTALKARSQAVRRRVRTRPLDDVPVESVDDTVWKDLRPVLDEEVQRLPSKYRMPVVLCYLEGKTLEEAARQLGWPAGTVSGRLARAKELLRRRLTRRGLGLAGGWLAAAFSQTATAMLPGSLRTATLQAALTLTTRNAGAVCLIPASVVNLMEGVLHTMFLTKVKTAVAVLFIAAVIGGGAGVVTYQEIAAQAPGQHREGTPKQVAPVKQKTLEEIAEEENKELEREQNLIETMVTPEARLKAILDASSHGQKMKSLLKARLDAVRTELKSRWKEYSAGRGTLDILVNSSRRFLEAERDLSTKQADQVAAWETHWQRMHQVYLINLVRYNAGRISIQDLAQADYFQLDAEIGLERAKAQGKPNR